MTNKINGYYLACRLLFVMLSENYIGGFHALCLDFGPLGWDPMPERHKFMLKLLTRGLTKSVVHSYHEIDSFFISQAECDYYCNVLKPAYNVLVKK